MSRWRLVAGVGVVAVLALTLIALSVRGDSSSNQSTTFVASPSTTTTTSPRPTTTTGPTTLTTTAEQRLAEVEALLQDLWFGWFDAIYRKDAEALWKVVATTTFHDAGLSAMETAQFISEPQINKVMIPAAEILLDREDCLVVFHDVDLSSFLGAGAISEVVTVLWPDNRHGFRFATDWHLRRDLWLGDCDNLVREPTP